MPELRVAIVDEKTNFDYWVGESTVEVWMDYATRVLKLGGYLSKHHIRKSGQRFFFDNEEKSLPLPQMSENGRSTLDLLGGAQLDRSKFDRDLCEFNRSLGVDIYLGEKVSNSHGAIELDGGKGHVVHTTDRTFRCRWLVDAGGRSSPLVRKLNLGGYDPRHPAHSYWARLEGCRDIDAASDDSNWQRRTNGRPLRFTATNHFMYRGYWIWLIPLSDTLMSVGVTFQDDIAPMSFKNGDELFAFFRKHPGLSEAIGPDAKLCDFHGLKRLSRFSEQQFSEDRWFLTGMSGMFTDPMLSSTSAQIAQSNCFIGEMIRTDQAGDAARFSSQVKHFNLAMRARYESQSELLRHYQFHGSFDIWSNFMGAIYSNYYISTVTDGTTDYRRIIDIANAHAHANCTCARTLRDGPALTKILVRLAEEFRSFLDRTGRYYERNRGEWCDPSILWSRPGLDSRWFRDRDLASEYRELKTTYKNFCLSTVRRMAEIEGVPFRSEIFDQSFRSWYQGQTLQDLLDAQRSHCPAMS